MSVPQLSARACTSTYVIFGIIGALAFGLAIPLLVTDGRTSLAAMFGGMWLGLLLWVWMFKLGVSDGVLSYRTLFGGTRSIRLSDVAKAELSFGPQAPFGPFYRLVIHPSPDVKNRAIVVNIKVFSRKDVNDFLDILGSKLKGGRRVSIVERRASRKSK